MVSLGQTLPGVDKNPDLITFTIKVGGEVVSERFQVLSFSVRKELNRIPVAHIIFSDGDPAAGSFDTSSAEYFVPGEELEIQVGYHSDEETLFIGLVNIHTLRIRGGEARLYVTCRDAAFQTTISRKNRFFEEVTDSDAIETILGDYSLTLDVATTSVTHQELVQYHATDWDFILSRADANGMFCFVDDGSISIQEPSFSEVAVECVFGTNILEFDGEIDGRCQHEGVIAKSWDFANQEIVEAEAQEPGYSGTGNLSGSQISSDLDQSTYELIHSGNINSEELQSWADAKLLRSRLAQARGRVKLKGFSEIKPGQMISLEGVGERFNGEVFVSGVLHNIMDGNWFTEIQFGMDEKWFAESYNISNLPASGLLPAIQGLQVGVVTQLEEDPEGENRIKVRLPIVDPEEEGIWARLSCLDAGEERGTFFRPEIEDEVIVGFINGDPRDAVVLGMLHSSAKPTPEEITNDNFKKGYLSREKLKMEFDDELKIITLETPEGNIVKLDEDMGGISMEDQNGNKITMNSDGITIESAADIIITTSSGDATIEAVNINASAQAGLTAEGSASAEISSGGTTTVKGSLVQIN